MANEHIQSLKCYKYYAADQLIKKIVLKLGLQSAVFS